MGRPEAADARAPPEPPQSTHLNRQITDRTIPEPDIQHHLGAATLQSLAGIADIARFCRSESVAQIPKPHARCGRGGLRLISADRFASFE
jgi:hypothetical protein